MPFCKYCGREIQPDEVCCCRNTGKKYTPDIDFSLEDNINIPSQAVTATPSAEIKKPVKKSGRIPRKYLVISIIILVLATALAGTAVFFCNAYKRPLNKFIRGVNKENSELIINQIMTEQMIDDFRESVTDTDTDWEDFCKETDDGIEEFKEYLEDDFGKHFKLSGEIEEKNNAKKRELKAIEKFYESMDYELDIQKAYKIRASVTFKGRDDEQTMKVWLYSAKIKDEGWKLLFDEETFYDLEYEVFDIIDKNVYTEIAKDIFKI